MYQKIKDKKIECVNGGEDEEFSESEEEIEEEDGDDEEEVPKLVERNPEIEK